MCVCCGGRLYEGEQMLCLRCVFQFPRTGMVATPDDNAMVHRLMGWTQVNRCLAAFYYTPGSRLSEAVGLMKYNHRDDVGKVLGTLMANETNVVDVFYDIDAIVPLPLHPRRQRQRGYNQAERLSIAVAERLGVPIIMDAVARIKYQDNQARMSHHEREDNIRGAFKVVDADALRGRKILVVDDIFTTGASIGTCIKAIADALGDDADTTEINVLTLAMTR